MPSGRSSTRRGWPLVQVIGRERRAERAAGVAGRRLDPDVLERAVAQHLAVGDAVERHAAGQAQILHARSPRASARVSRSTTSSVTAWIEAARSMSRCVEQLLRLARRPAEQRVELARWSCVRPVQ